MYTTRAITIRIASFMLFTTLSGIVQAENMGFLPGDAFFHGKLSSFQIEEAGSTGVVSLKYSTPTPGSFSGYAGYFRLNLKLDDKVFLSNLSKAYDILRYHSPKLNRVEWEYKYEGDTLIKGPSSKEVEDNPLGVFVYNKEIDIESIRLSVKYNENWESEVALFNKRASRRPLLDEFVKTYECVSESWCNAERVPALKAELPKVEFERGKGIDQPILCNASDCAVVLTSDRNHKDIFTVSNIRIVVVTSATVDHFVGNGGDWEKQETPNIVQKPAE